MSTTTGAVTWNKGLLPTGIIFFLLAVIGALFRVMLAGGDAPNISGSEALFWMWPAYFGLVGLVAIAGSIVLKGKPAELAGMALQKNSEVISLALSVAFGIGFLIALPVMAMQDPLNMSSAGAVWDTIKSLSGASLVGMLTTMVCGGVAGPTLVGALLSRVGLSRILILVVQGLIFVIGVILAIILFQNESLKSMSILRGVITGALLFAPLGIFVYATVAPRSS